METSNKSGGKQSSGRAHIAMALMVTSAFFAPHTESQTPQTARVPDVLHQWNDSVEALVQRVSHIVAQILV